MKTNLFNYSTFIFTMICLSLPNVNFAQHWSHLDSKTTHSLHDLYFLNASYGVAVGDSATVLRTRDGGANWEPLALETRDHVFSVIVPGEDTILVATGTYWDGTIFLTTDGGDHWTPVEKGIELAQNNSQYFALNWQELLHSQDKGEHWEPTDIEFGSTDLLNQISFPDDTTGYVMGLISGFSTYSAFGFRSIDGGASWASLFPFDFPSSDALTTSFFPNADLGFLFTNRYEHFEPGHLNRLVKIDHFYFDPSPAIMEWRFQAEIVNDSLPTYINSAFFFDEQEGYAAGENGSIYYTNDGGAHWEQSYEGNMAIKAIKMLDKNTGYAVGDGGTILKFEFTTATQEPSPVLPLQFYPNPASSVAYLNGLESYQGVLALYNSLGQRLRQVTLNGNNVVDLSGLPAGWYTIQLRSGQQIYTGKIIVR